MEPIRIVRPHSARDLRLSRLASAIFFPFGLVFLFIGLVVLYESGYQALLFILPGIALCAGPLIVYRSWKSNSDVFLRSNVSVEGRVVDHTRKKVRVKPWMLDPVAGSAEGCNIILNVILIIIDLLLLLLERVGLREAQYRYTNHKLIVNFPATSLGHDESKTVFEIKVDESQFLAYPLGSTLKMRYAKEKPQVALLEDEFQSKFGKATARPSHTPPRRFGKRQVESIIVLAVGLLFILLVCRLVIVTLQQIP